MNDRTLPDNFHVDEATVEGKAVVITGGTTGIGRATALLLKSQGAKVLICGRHEGELDDAMRDLGAGAYGVIADISEPRDVERLFTEADARLGGVDVLINNAAIAANDVAESSPEDMRYVVSTNLLGNMYCTHEAIKRMKQGGGGRILNVGSMSATVREKGSSVYVATKSAIQGMSEALRKEVNELGIQILLVEPGSVGTDMQESSPEEQRDKEANQEMLKAEDIALVILHALTMPSRADIVQLDIRPHLQPI